MLILIYIIAILLTMHNDALACYVANHKYNIKASFISALFWPMSIVLVIANVYKVQKSVGEDK